MKAYAKISTDSMAYRTLGPTGLPFESTHKNFLDITFDKGLVGFKEYSHYRLIELDHPLYSPVKILVNLQVSGFSLLLMEMKDIAGLVLNPAELIDAPYQYLQNLPNVGCYFILTVRKPGPDLLFTANTRAPVFIDFITSQAQQYILPPHNSYAYPLTGFSSEVKKRRLLQQH